MIPALLAAPVVQGVLGQVAALLSPSSPAPTAPPPFTTHLQAATAPSFTAGSRSGTLISSDWSRMSPTDLKSWAESLSGRHVFATDVSGRVYSGTVNVVEATAGTPALNIGGHLVSLSQLKQVSWSPAIA